MFGEMLEKLVGEGGDERISVVAEIVARSGHEEEIRVLLHSLVTPSRAEAGCLKYHLLEDKHAPGSFSTYEEWTGEAALEKHLAGEGAKAALAKAEPLMEGKMKLRVLRMLM